MGQRRHKAFVRVKLLSAVSGIAICMSAAGLVAEAQQTSQAGPDEASGQSDTGTPAQTETNRRLNTVTVTARKREESDLSVPVSMSAISGVELDRSGISDLTSISEEIPSLQINTNTVNSGGNIALRGVSSASTSSSSVEQAVAVNIDGVPVSYAGIVKLGQLDLGQVEVLKGPQALFFGKNSTGGIISLRSAEPTDEFEVMLRSGYEFEADQVFAEGIVSGPLAETLKGRLALRASDMKGWIDNIVPANVPGSFGAADDRAPGGEEFLAKGTLIFDPTNDLSVKLRGAYADHQGQSFSISQRYFCPNGGVPQGPAVAPGETDCTMDNINSHGDLNPALNAVDPRFPADGVPYQTVEQSLIVLDATYSLNDWLTLNSVTGLYDIALHNSDHVGFGAISAIEFAITTEREALTQELRLSTEMEGPFNWMLGLFYEDAFHKEDQTVVIFGNVIPDIGSIKIEGETISPFIQASYDISDTVTLSGGARYSKETKTQKNAAFGGQLPDELEFTNTSPEVTLSYQPNENANYYATYRQGYKSGGFQLEWVSIPSALAGGVQVDNSFKEETVEGFEVGTKHMLFDGVLRLNTAAYQFKYKDLQLGRFDSDVVALILDNIAGATVEGVEADFVYAPPIEGLRLRGAVAYNNAVYDEFLAGCYNGQTVALGCDAATNLQDLSGRQLPRAPKWSGNVAMTYENRFGNGVGYRLNAGLSYNGRHEVGSEGIPDSQQDEYVFVDAGVAFSSASEQWELALIGRNLADKYIVSSGFQTPLTGSAAGGIRSDLTSVSPRGREVMLRLTYRPTMN